MMKYCENCGRPLREGEVCVCTQRKDMRKPEEVNQQTVGNRRSGANDQKGKKKHHSKRRSGPWPWVLLGGAVVGLCAAAVYLFVLSDTGIGKSPAGKEQAADTAGVEDEQAAEGQYYGHDESVLESIAAAKELEQRISENIFDSADKGRWVPALFQDALPYPEDNIAYVGRMMYGSDGWDSDIKIFVMAAEHGELRIRIVVKEKDYDGALNYNDEALYEVMNIAPLLLNAFCNVDEEMASEAMSNLAEDFAENNDDLSATVGEAMFTIEVRDVRYYCEITSEQNAKEDVPGSRYPCFVELPRFLELWRSSNSDLVETDVVEMDYPEISGYYNRNGFVDYMYYVGRFFDNELGWDVYSANGYETVTAVKIPWGDDDEEGRLIIGSDPTQGCDWAVAGCCAAMMGEAFEDEGSAEKLIGSVTVDEGETVLLPCGVLLDWWDHEIVLH